MNLPEAFEIKMKKLLGDGYEDYLKCFDEPRHFGLRVNTSKISAENFVKISPWPLKKVPWIHNGFYYDGEKYQPAKHPYYFAGLYYLQEPSAMTPADRLPVDPGDKVLDVCAAPGGKATELGARLNGTGLLAANDLSNSRAKGLLKNIELMGIGNVLVLSEEPGKLIPYFAEYFDKILIDAPCSGEGMFRKDRKMIRAWEEHGPEYFSKGYEGFSQGIPEVTVSADERLKQTVRIFPHRMNGEGHFLALLKKGSSKNTDDNSRRKSEDAAAKRNRKKLPGELEEFLSDIKREFDPERIDIRSDKVYYMPEGLPALNGVRFLRTGLLLGELKKKRFEPSQAFAMNLKKDEYPRILDLPVSDERVVKYLKGETLDVEDLVSAKDKGWYLVCTDGFPLGFGKLAGQVLKNKYLPGWRWQSA